MLISYSLPKLVASAEVLKRGEKSSGNFGQGRIEYIWFFGTLCAIIAAYRMGLISFDVGTFTSDVRKPEANVRFQKVSSTANFISRVKAAFQVPSFAPAYA